MGSKTKHGEMYMYENANPTPIDITATYHPLRFYSVGELHGFTFDAGSTGVVASVATYADGAKIQVTDIAHGLLDGEIVVFVNSTDYDGAYIVEEKTDNTFVVTVAYNVDRTFNWYQPSTLKCNAGSGGTYHIAWTLACDSTSNGKAFKFEPNINIIPVDTAASATLFSNGTDYESIAANGVVSVVAGDYIWMSCQNLTDAADLLTYHANMNLTRI